MDELYYHDTKQRWLILKDKYYHWTTGVGWKAVQGDLLPDRSLFHPLHPKQKDAFEKGLQEQGLIN